VRQLIDYNVTIRTVYTTNTNVVKILRSIGSETRNYDMGNTKVRVSSLWLIQRRCNVASVYILKWSILAVNRRFVRKRPKITRDTSADNC